MDEAVTPQRLGSNDGGWQSMAGLSPVLTHELDNATAHTPIASLRSASGEGGWRSGSTSQAQLAVETGCLRQNGGVTAAGPCWNERKRSEARTDTGDG